MFGYTYLAELDKSLIFFEACYQIRRVIGVYQNNKIIGLATLTQEVGAKFCS